MNEQKPDNTFTVLSLSILFVLVVITWMLHEAGILDDIIERAYALFFTR